MAVDRQDFDYGPQSQRGLAKIDVLHVIPPLDRIPLAATQLILEAKLKLRPTQQVLQNHRIEDPPAYEALAKMFGEHFPAVDLTRPIDLQGKVRSTREFLEELFRMRREAHLIMASATVDPNTPNNERSTRARHGVEKIESARERMDKRLQEVIVPDQLPHTIYVVRLTDGVMAHSRAELANQYLNQEYQKRQRDW